MLASILVLMISFSTLASCGEDSPTAPSGVVTGSGVLVQQDRSVSGFTAVSLVGVGTVRIEEGTQEALTVEAESNLLQYIQTEVQGGVLIIRTAPGVDINPTQPIQFFVTVVSLNRVVLEGVGDIELSGLSTERLTLELTGVGGIFCTALDAEVLNVRLSGVGDVTVSGQVVRQTATLSGVGNYQARNLASDRATLQLNGSGSATVRVRSRLTATITGSGSVFYIGSPALVVTITGSGTVEQIGG
jgi:hypothetical protein